MPTSQQQTLLNIFTCVLLIVVLAFHFRASSTKPYKRETQRILISWFGTIIVAAAFIRIVLQDHVNFADVFVATLTFGVVLYVALCDLLLSGLAVYLTKQRGEKWVKEMDYVYLAFGALGLYGSISRMPNLTLTFNKLDLVGPLILMAALVVRFVKTRVEIAGWNKLPNGSSPPS